MNKLNYLKKVILLFALLAAFTSCSNDDDNSTTNKQDPLNIVETAQSVPELSILVDAITQAGLIEALSAEGNKTVLAPTNDAFEDFLAEKGFTSLSEVPNTVLEQILLNHVIGGTNYTSSALTGKTGYENTLASGPNATNLSIFYDGTDGVTFNGVSSVETADVNASNGIVHVVDAVIDLPTIATFATSNNALSTLVDALVYADSGTPTVPYISTVSDANTGPFTVFAPTNDAFAALLIELQADALTSLPTEVVDGVLLNHIVNANVQSNGLMTGTVTTLGGDIEADVTNFTLTDQNNRVSNIVTSLVDIQSINGVVHVIDQVILPLQ